MRTIDVSVRVLDTAGGLLLNLTPANGYTVTGSPDEGTETWLSEEQRSPFVGGAEVDTERLDTIQLPLTVRIKGGTWVQVEQRRAALRAAFNAPSRLLEYAVEGVTTTWRTVGRPQASSPYTTSDVVNCKRTVVLQVRAQPTATVTGLVP